MIQGVGAVNEHVAVAAVTVPTPHASRVRRALASPTSRGNGARVSFLSRGMPQESIVARLQWL